MRSRDLFAAVEDARVTLEGWCSEKKARDLAQTVLDFHSDVSVEIGVFGGKSLCALALAHDFTERGKVWGIDPWTHEAAVAGWADEESLKWWGHLDIEGIFHGMLRAFIQHDMLRRCLFLRTTSEDAHGRLFEPIDLLHLDGNPSEAATTLDVFLYLPKVRKGGHVFVGDSNWHSKRNAVRLVAEQCDLLREVESEGAVYSVYRKR